MILQAFIPISKRYCLACNKATKFKFDEKTNHSKCVNCGGWKLNAKKNNRLQARRGRVFWKKLKNKTKNRNIYKVYDTNQNLNT